MNKQFAATGVACLGSAALVAGCGGPSVSVNPQASTAQPSTSASPSASKVIVEATKKDVPTSWTPSKKDIKNKNVYLTFDDGPGPYTEGILKILRDNDAKATFFEIGVMIRTREDIVKKVAADGHAIGNHTWKHLNLTQHTDKEVRWQLNTTTKHIGSAMGPCMRPPYGATTKRVAKITKSLGLTQVPWNADVNDWKNPGVASIEATMRQVRPGTVILMHDGGGFREATTTALRLVLPELRMRGYHFLPVPVCVNAPGQTVSGTS